ncbi:type II secretory pathway protein [Lentilactobacillus parabuchneri]|uniref:Type II secretory pathway protein n=1 Tax=Lentilactobacillus parabuchneri TaxID=152331 RepID=A0A844EGQ1_9LACO|nr:type II secretion system F family protein [Lentilactobacillus parabuchneri]MBW0263083.1 type II secretion system F family protein [Lentilactobacillus parabuchneri]MCT2885064.1 type II secretory pathway protein [Lentilactobacillus parabuchneri]MSE21229.1 type II secretory pathway protein [Lentilactobacillus parabuchneri]OBU97657.1 type II secretory pathway protein [Lentilactobacillus parabuchneri]
MGSRQPLTASWLHQRLPRNSNLAKKWPVAVQAGFFDSLANLLSIGFSLTEALKFMEQTERQLSVGVHQIIESLKEGLEFSESIRPLIEAQAYHQLLIAEKHGQLSEVLEELARFDRLRMKQLKKIKAMLVYPLFLCLILGVLIMMIRVFVFPQIQQLMPDDPVQSAPSLGMQLVKLLPLPILIGALIFIGYWSRLDAISRAQFIVKVPLIGKLFRKYIAYYLASNLATLLRNGLSVKEIYATLSEFKSGSLIHLLGEKLHAALMEGQSVKNLVNRHKFIPNEIVKFMTSGNTIPEMANSMTAYSKLMFDEMILATDKMIAFIQPAMFVLIGVTIVGTYFQLLIPIYNSVKGMY